MRRSLVLSVLLAAASLATAASAHETLPKTWCSNGASSPLILEDFAFDGAKLEELGIKCGIVDQPTITDDWMLATEAVGAYCRSLAPAGDQPIAVVSGPKKYLRSSHHEDYSLSDGLYGVCAVCVTP